MALRPARLLPPKRLLTPRSARRLSATNRGLLPGAPAITRVGLAPTGLVQPSGRNIPSGYRGPAPVARAWVRRAGAGARPADRLAAPRSGHGVRVAGIPIETAGLLDDGDYAGQRHPRSDSRGPPAPPGPDGPRHVGVRGPDPAHRGRAPRGEDHPRLDHRRASTGRSGLFLGRAHRDVDSERRCSTPSVPRNRPARVRRCSRGNPACRSQGSPPWSTWAPSSAPTAPRSGGRSWWRSAGSGPSPISGRRRPPPPRSSPGRPPSRSTAPPTGAATSPLPASRNTVTDSRPRRRPVFLDSTRPRPSNGRSSGATTPGRSCPEPERSRSSTSTTGWSCPAPASDSPPGCFQGQSMAQVAGDLSDPSNPDTQAVLGAANTLAAAVCAATGGRPAIGVRLPRGPGRSEPTRPPLIPVEFGGGVSRRGAAAPACARSRSARPRCRGAHGS